MDHQEDYGAVAKKSSKQHNVLPLWGNEATMNLNPLILANIQGSSYFKVHLFKLKTYHEVVDEIYYQVKHLEPWERGSRKTAGQTGMCGGVRGVGAGGIVSTAFCLLYKLYTLRLTRKQVNGLLTHTDSPYIRALGFMYIRYTQPPADLYDWYEDYLLDEEEIDVKAGGGQVMTIGQMVYQFLTKLDWFSTLFPRIPVPIQKQIEKKLEDFSRTNNVNFHHLHVQHAAPPQQQRQHNNYAAAAAVAEPRPGKYPGAGGGGGAGVPGPAGPEKEREREFREIPPDRRRRDDREIPVPRDREREERGGRDREREREYYSHREERYERSRSTSRSRDRSEFREKHRKKHKNKDRDRSRERKEEHHKERSSTDRHRDREHERKYR